MADLTTEQVQTFPSVHEWLKSISLHQYWEKFESEGYNDLTFLVRLSEEEIGDMLKNVDLTKSGRIQKFKKCIKELLAAAGKTTEENPKEGPETKIKKQTSKFNMYMIFEGVIFS